MPRRRLLPCALSLFTLCGAVCEAQAALVARNLDADAATAEAWYDTSTGLTWLQDLSAIAGSAYAQPGQPGATLDNAVAWLAGLTYDGDWRLPTLSEAQAIYLTTLGNGSGTPRINAGPFTGLGEAGQSGNDRFIWTSSFFYVHSSGGDVNYLWGTQNGTLDAALESNWFKVWGVASGDVGSALDTTGSSVPEPGALALSLLALGAAAWAGRRRA